MKQLKNALLLPVPCAAMLMLILDGKTALQGAREGLSLCAQTVIPSLFPFFVMSILLTSALSGHKIAIFSPILRFCKMPENSENLLIIGFLGGYPVGAKCIYDCWKADQISKADAQRCLGFCSNAGPAFLFGMCGMLFSDSWAIWVLWGIHIVSALIVGNLLPGNRNENFLSLHNESVSLPKAMSMAIHAMLSVCGWIVLFKVMIVFAQRWLLWALPSYWSIAVQGFLELANGCSCLYTLESEGLRFVLCSGFLAFGGLCVALQTCSVTGELGTGTYFRGKVLQCIISICFATLFAAFKYHLCSPVIPLIIGFVFALLVISKKTVAFHKRLVYNEEKKWKGDFLCYFERKLQNPAAIAPVERK